LLFALLKLNRIPGRALLFVGDVAKGAHSRVRVRGCAAVCGRVCLCGCGCVCVCLCLCVPVSVSACVK
jgi:hypothetical protein